MHVLGLVVAADATNDEEHRPGLLGELEVKVELAAVGQDEQLALVVLDDLSVRVHVDLFDAGQD